MTRRINSHDLGYSVAVPRQRLCMTELGNLDEMLFNNAFRTLVDLLIVPVSTTTVMSKLKQAIGHPKIPDHTWYISQERRREIYWSCDQRNVCNSPRKIERSKSLRNNERPSLTTLGKRKRCRSFHATGSFLQGSIVTKLPSEILDKIFDNLDNLQNAIVLGLTCQRMWTFALRRYCDWMSERNIGQWAGLQLVTVGGDADDVNDYPPGLFSAQEMEDLQAEGVPEYNCCEEVIQWWQFDMNSFLLQEVVQGWNNTPVDAFCKPQGFIEGLARSGRLDPAFDVVVCQLALCLGAYAPADEMWMLRNLTTREFVRAEAIAIRQEYIHGPFIEKLGFHHVLLARTCWSSQPEAEVEKLHLPVPHKGPWAADAFEICTVTRHRDLVRSTGEPWSDVSEEVAAEMDRLWTARYGTDWRAVVCAPGFGPRTFAQFTIVAPDRLAELDMDCEIDELLFGTELAHLVDLLIAPLSTQEVLSRIRRQPKATPSDTHETISKRALYGTFKRFAHISTIPTHKNLRRSQSCEPKGSSGMPRRLVRRRRSWEMPSRRCTLTNLPNEVVNNIFERLTDIDDVAALGLTCRRMWSFALFTICDWALKHTGNWVGSRIACVDVKCKLQDYPPGMLSNGKIRELKEMIKVPIGFRRGRRRPYTNLAPPNGVYNGGGSLGIRSHFVPTEYWNAPEQHLKALWARLARNGRLDPSFDRVSHQLHLQTSHYTPDGDSWVLQNLTTHEFVRDDAVTIKSQFKHGPRINSAGFGHVLLMHICWNHSIFADWSVQRLNHRGKWAGHRFEIVPLARHVEMERDTGEPWSDVSHGVAVAFDAFWSSLYGTDWRVVISEPGFKYSDVKNQRMSILLHTAYERISFQGFGK